MEALCVRMYLVWFWCLPCPIQFFLKPLDKLWLMSSVGTASGSTLPTLPQRIFLYQIYGWRQILKWCITLKVPWHGRLKWDVMNFNQCVTAKWCSRTEIFKNTIINRFTAPSCLGQATFHVVISQMWQWKCLQTLNKPWISSLVSSANIRSFMLCFISFKREKGSAACVCSHLINLFHRVFWSCYQMVISLGFTKQTFKAVLCQNSSQFTCSCQLIRVLPSVYNVPASWVYQQKDISISSAMQLLPGLSHSSHPRRTTAHAFLPLCCSWDGRGKTEFRSGHFAHFSVLTPTASICPHVKTSALHTSSALATTSRTKDRELTKHLNAGNQTPDSI